MSRKTQIKIIERRYQDVMERTVNAFIDCLEIEPINITFGNSFSWEWEDGLVLYTPKYTAVIEYIATPGNIDAVKLFNDMYE